ncbi:hypothetical protein L9Z73_05485 [Pseudomonas sp. TNT11]|uniref:Uncharacterized protein n=1 Tax=Pseudomonas emilianonis TaxID=2915812 RepID=A0ABT0EDN9_9PSED|nr:hypothetical protein [Pseudomonas emilianonis]MCK1783831.1 hypothetical protein [Pseudomonas emilianonis]
MLLNMEDRRPMLSGTSKRWAEMLSKALLLIVLVCVFVPFDPAMPTYGLDASWVFGMNQAVSQGLRIGTDVVFTFGPYASIYTRAYHPATDTLMLLGSSFLAISCWISILFLVRSRPGLILALCVPMLLSAHSRDALLLFIPLLAALVVYRISQDERGPRRASPATYAVLLIAFAAVGLIPIVKGSLLLLSLTITLGCALMFVLNKEKTLALFSLCVPVLSLVVFWVAAGQDLSDLGSFFVNIAPIISGYTEAMAYSGKNREIALYLICAVLLMVCVFKGRKTPIALVDLYVPGVYFLFLFICFKAAFVRHDAHALTGAVALIFAVLTLLLFRKGKLITFVLILSVVTTGVIFARYVGFKFSEVVRVYDWAFVGAQKGIERRLSGENWPQSQFDELLAGYKKNSPLPLLPGRSDIYSYNQAVLISSGNTWAPRPIIQSYSVYTSDLAEKNRDYLLSKNAPDNIFFKVEPIDGRLPSMEDGTSWPALLTHYRPVKQLDEYLRLEKLPSAPASTGIKPGVVLAYKMGEDVALASTDKILVARVVIKPTVLGRLANILFKPAELKISATLMNGEVRTYRVVSGMLKSGVILSPLVESTPEFSYLYEGTDRLLDKRVKSVKIFQEGRSSRSWQPEYTLALDELDVAHDADLSSVYNVGEWDKEAGELPMLKAQKCAGGIDAINGRPATSSIKVGRGLSVTGWLASSLEDGTVPDAAYLVLTDESGKRSFVKGAVAARPDVAKAYNKPTLARAGYSIAIDTIGLQGAYVLQLAMKTAGHIEICPEYSIFATLNDQVKQ